MADNLDVHPRAEIPEFRIVSCGNGAHLEIFEFIAPDQNKQMPKASDYGSTHFSFYVDDMNAAIAYLKSKGVRVLGGKKDGIGPEAGEESSFAHFKTPWGHLIEIVSFPKGRVYEKEKPSMWVPSK